VAESIQIGVLLGLLAADAARECLLQKFERLIGRGPAGPGAGTFLGGPGSYTGGGIERSTNLRFALQAPVDGLKSIRQSAHSRQLNGPVATCFHEIWIGGDGFFEEVDRLVRLLLFDRNQGAAVKCLGVPWVHLQYGGEGLASFGRQ